MGRQKVPNCEKNTYNFMKNSLLVYSKNKQLAQYTSWLWNYKSPNVNL